MWRSSIIIWRLVTSATDSSRTAEKVLPKCPNLESSAMLLLSVRLGWRLLYDSVFQQPLERPEHVKIEPFCHCLFPNFGHNEGNENSLSGQRVWLFSIQVNLLLSVGDNPWRILVWLVSIDEAIVDCTELHTSRFLPFLAGENHWKCASGGPCLLSC